jgi:hypothetical protein
MFSNESPLRRRHRVWTQDGAKQANEQDCSLYHRSCESTSDERVPGTDLF